MNEAGLRIPWSITVENLAEVEEALADGPHHPAGDRPPRLHDGRPGRRHRPHRDRAAPGRHRGPRRQPDQPGAGRGVGDRLGRVRARGDARPQRQRRDHLLDRERRPDGRPHRRLGHRRARADADRPALPGPARPGDQGDPGDRGRDRRLQRPVRGQPRERRDRRDRDEPARLPLLGPGLEGDRLPDREDGGEAGGRLRAGGDPQRHHPRHAGLLRADDRLRRHQDPALRLREVPRLRGPPLHLHAERRRGDGDRPHLPRVLRQGDALARARLRGRDPRVRGGAAGRDRDALRRALRPDPRGLPSAASRSRPCTRPAWSTAGSCASCRRWPPKATAPRASSAPTRRSTPAPPSSRRRRPTTTPPTSAAATTARPPANEIRRGEQRLGRHPRRRPEPDRPGDRVRLLLRPRRDDRARARPRRGDGQLQPGDGLDRLRHLRPPLLRAADRRGRARRLRAGAARRA